MLAPLKTAEPIDEHMQKALQSDERPWHLRALVAPAMASFGTYSATLSLSCGFAFEPGEILRSSPRKRGPRGRRLGPWIPACGGMNGGEIRYEYELAVRIRKRTEHCNEVQNCHSRVRRNVERRSIGAGTARGQDWRARSAVRPDRADRHRRGGRDQDGRRDRQRG